EAFEGFVCGKPGTVEEKQQADGDVSGQGEVVGEGSAGGCDDRDDHRKDDQHDQGVEVFDSSYHSSSLKQS
ncbi:hypothetical protein B178_10763, partial [Corynebacterium diphtheriae DSM 43988]